MAHDVFVSHSVKDKAVADAIVARLEADSVTCWIAPRDVVPGADWGESIINAIESSRIMILVFSRSADASSQIKREVERAVNKGVYIIPFRVDDIEPTRSLEYFISASQWMDAFSPPLERHLDNLTKTVKSVLQSPPLPGASVPVQSERKSPMATAPIPRPSSRKAIPIAVAIAVLMIVGGAGWYLGHKREAVATPTPAAPTLSSSPLLPSRDLEGSISIPSNFKSIQPKVPQSARTVLNRRIQSADGAVQFAVTAINVRGLAPTVEARAIAIPRLQGEEVTERTPSREDFLSVADSRSPRDGKWGDNYYVYHEDVTVEGPNHSYTRYFRVDVSTSSSIGASSRLWEFWVRDEQALQTYKEIYRAFKKSVKFKEE